MPRHPSRIEQVVAGATGSMRARVAVVMASSLQHRELARALSQLGRNRKLVLGHAVQWCAVHDDLAAIEAVVPRNDTASLRIVDIVDQPLGRQNYTALCLAAYHGSPRVVRYLIGVGADVAYVNSHGEDLARNLDIGEMHAVEANMDNAVFVRERFRVARRHIELRQLYLRRQCERATVDYTPRRPPRIRAALRVWAWWCRVRPRVVRHQTSRVVASHA